ncbi:endo alpha-1,4 polygalactosaminidase [Rhodanobacter sp. AS-Z3]|uniref:bifunctional glycoside hydrolase 114/ polysaccharide deacetylase family protein n=1 Tax=Rhodanobacter sp. AS-Z3 TaxID=3031330 RepID=UPI0024786F50|nr:endo alpha-1,4 polygalactosaminidase [Rhodanobacter sp. AS-Z3]WEN15818.1 endo alpha-1,4 polygalactosaminidase [Rhodanobacter sp. AS-Z3]
MSVSYQDVVISLMTSAFRKPTRSSAQQAHWLFLVGVVMACLIPIAASASVSDAPTREPTVALYYGPNPPISALQGFDWIVVDGNAQLPEEVSGVGPGQHGADYFAYLSVGEVAESAVDAPPPDCVLGQNKAWKARIVDLRQDNCRDWVWQQRIAPLIDRGFRHFFLDTLDSYQLALSAPDDQRAYRAGMVALVSRLRARLPQAQFILNRGFELLDDLHDQGVVGVAAESLYRGWDQAKQLYVSVKPADTEWLKQQLDAVKSRGLVPIAIDYVPDGSVAEARSTAERIMADGFVPYVSNAQLNRVGVGRIQPDPREILMLYDGDDSPMSTNVNWYGAMVLNHLGYATRTLNVDAEALPQLSMRGRVAGIVTWFSGSELKQSEAIHRWLRRQVAAGVPIAMLGEFGFAVDAAHLAPFGIEPGPAPSADLEKISIVSHDPGLTGFESPPRPSPDDFQSLRLLQGRSALTLQRGEQQEVAVAIMPWGGYALAPHVISYLPQGGLEQARSRSRWVLNPFAFFRQALKLGDLPAFDTTTASGNRLLFAQFDGDGFASGSYVEKYLGQPAAKVIVDEILTRYPIPTAASVIAAEFVDHGLYDAQKLAIYRPIARAMFALPWVEIGSHTYSHPFDWTALERDPSLSAGLHIESRDGGKNTGEYQATAKLQYGYNLPVPGYRFSLQQEVQGSVQIINELLAPAGKHVRLYQWSGDTDPGANVLAKVYEAGLLNINGNNSTITDQYSSLTSVVPLGVWKGAHFQVFAPDANEDQFTNGWTAPYCGYRKVLQTFRLTESPRRLAPINVYYHLYSGARPCALDALHEVYDWATAQATTPVFPSDYARIALGFEYAGVARDGDAFVLGGYGSDETVRIAQTQGYPDLAHSDNIAGFNDANDARYISLGPRRARLVLTSTKPDEPYLVSANAVVTDLQRRPGSLGITLHGEVSLKLVLANTRGCQVRFDDQPVQLTGRAGQQLYSSVAHAGRLDIACRR